MAESTWLCIVSWHFQYSIFIRAFFNLLLYDLLCSRFNNLFFGLLLFLVLILINLLLWINLINNVLFKNTLNLKQIITIYLRLFHCSSMFSFGWWFIITCITFLLIINLYIFFTFFLGWTFLLNFIIFVTLRCFLL